VLAISNILEIGTLDNQKIKDKYRYKNIKEVHYERKSARGSK
jgi:hypothetical protein